MHLKIKIKVDETHSRGDEIMEIPKLAPFSSQSNLLNKCWPDTGLGCMVSQVKVRNLLLYHINEFVIWKLMITNNEEMKLEVGITIPKLTVSKKKSTFYFDSTLNAVGWSGKSGRSVKILEVHKAWQVCKVQKV